MLITQPEVRTSMGMGSCSVRVAEALQDARSGVSERSARALASDCDGMTVFRIQASTNAGGAQLPLHPTGCCPAPTPQSNMALQSPLPARGDPMA